MPTFNDSRIRRANDAAPNPAGKYVLYWCQMVRRLAHNHALDYALHWSGVLKKPLVVYEGLKLSYPWANARHHTFLLEGMRDNAAAAKALGISYWPFVETPAQPGRGLVRQLLADACLLVTDDYPGYIVPAQIRAAATANVAVHAVDGNGVVPLALLGATVSAAAHLRPRLHKLFPEAWAHAAQAEPTVPKAAKGDLKPPFATWKVPKDIPAFVASLPVDASVPPLAKHPGGRAEGLAVLADFLTFKLKSYATGRNQPDDPARTAASRLSPYLRHGHISVAEVCEGVLNFAGPWDASLINPRTRGRDDFFCRDANINGYLDEAITWRDVGYHWHYRRNAELGMRSAEWKNVSWGHAGELPAFNFETMDFSPLSRGVLDAVLPPWALASLAKHAADRREHVYTLEQFENADTHDELWNAAQTELVTTGRIHNYLRMLWGKKVLEWSASPEEAYRALEQLNNKYAIDGRDPNSYTGILWCFGLFDRPWPPEREVFGNVRYMSSGNTAKKFKLHGYYEYVGRTGNAAAPSLFEGA